MRKEKVFIVIVNYNNKKTLGKCLRSAFSSDGVFFEVVVVDNASKDGSLEEAKSDFPRAHFILSQKNLGFSAGANLGVRFALEKGADAIFFLNSDATVERNTLALCVDESFRNGNEALLSPIIYHDPELVGTTKTMWFCGGDIDWGHMRCIHRNPQKISQKTETEYLTGCALYVPSSVFAKIGLLDERYFLYYEDADFSLRAKRAGYRLLVIPQTHVFHGEQSVDNPQKIYWLVRSGMIFFLKNASFYLRPWIWLYFFARWCKNKRDLWKNPRDKTARMVEKAYKETLYATKTTHDLRDHR